MRRRTAIVCVVTVLALASLAVAATFTVAIQVAPATIVRDAPCEWVTVHADIPYSSVNTETVLINGFDADWVFPDNRGDLVAKVEFENIAPSVGPPSAVITLQGVTTSGAAFTGSATVRVK